MNNVITVIQITDIDIIGHRIESSKTNYLIKNTSNNLKTDIKINTGTETTRMKTESMNKT